MNRRHLEPKALKYVWWFNHTRNFQFGLDQKNVRNHCPLTFHFRFQDGIKLKIPSKINPPLQATLSRHF